MDSKKRSEIKLFDRDKFQWPSTYNIPIRSTYIHKQFLIYGINATNCVMARIFLFYFSDSELSYISNLMPFYFFFHFNSHSWRDRFFSTFSTSTYTNIYTYSTTLHHNNVIICEIDGPLIQSGSMKVTEI